MGIMDTFKKMAINGTLGLTKRERILIISFCLVPTTLLILIMYIAYPDYMILKFLLVIYILLIPSLYAFYYAPEKFVEKYKRNSDIHPRLTYQYYSKSYSLFLPGLVACVLFLGDVFNEWFLAIIICAAFIIPFISAFFRTDVFNDSSCIMGDEILFGYPAFYPFFSLFIGLFGFYNVYNFLNVNSNNAILLFIITLLFQIIFVIPDWANKIVPFEIRKKEGFILYSTLSGGAYLLISYCLTGRFMFPPIPIKFSPENIIIYGIGIIFLILIIKQGRNMGKKEN